MGSETAFLYPTHSASWHGLITYCSNGIGQHYSDFKWKPEHFRYTSVANLSKVIRWQFFQTKALFTFQCLSPLPFTFIPLQRNVVVCSFLLKVSYSCVRFSAELPVTLVCRYQLQPSSYVQLPPRGRERGRWQSLQHRLLHRLNQRHRQHHG